LSFVLTSILCFISNKTLVPKKVFGLSVIHEFINQLHTKCSGTIEYMAPEVIRTRKYDTKADIYSLGIIVDKLFTFNTKSYANCYLIFQFFIEWVFLRTFNSL
jgi:serine/threonine protein kinase